MNNENPAAKILFKSEPKNPDLLQSRSDVLSKHYFWKTMIECFGCYIAALCINMIAPLLPVKI
jgi:hypothetical protein